MLTATAVTFDNVNRSPVADGKIAAKISVKRLDVLLRRVTIAVSLGSSANWNR